MKLNLRILFLLGTAFLIPGCATYIRSGLSPERAAEIEKGCVRCDYSPSHEIEEQILALNATNVTERDIRETLAQAPAPRIINIHGGIYPVHRRLISFSEFLIGMGYPEASILNPGDSTYTFSCYESSHLIAGMIAWYYEKEGLRPMMVGHSQGGMQAVKVLDLFAGPPSSKLSVWNPLTWKEEKRCQITDPLTGKSRPVVGLRLPYATSMGAGGLTRILPNQWDMNFRLRTIPDSVEEFTGFYLGLDLLGGDVLGFGSANLYKAEGVAKVRNVQLPTAYHHCTIPCTQHLAENPQVKDWVNNFNTPTDKPEFNENFSADTANILWAADVWHSIKKHWVLELQNLIRAQRARQP
ncbi:MAG: hypothetical protein NTZ16_01155 [Verrucomicrobia bacterium]|nr:hypothetical protein [Verrucomicrobiota bacterium]